MTTINLYQNQEVSKEEASARAANGGFFFSVGILALTIAAFFGIRFYIANINKQNVALAESVAQQNQSLAGVNNLQRILEMQARLDQIKNNLQIKNGAVNQLKMTEVLNYLSQDLSSGVAVSSFVFDGTKTKISFNAGSYNDAARQILNFKKSTHFSDASLDNIVRGEKNVSVDMTMTVVKNNQ